MTPAVRAWVRARWRAEWRGLLVLSILVGLAGGGVMAATSGARRTASSLDRLAEVSKTADYLVDVGDGGPSMVRAIDELPSVVTSASTSVVFGIVDGIDADIGVFLPRDPALGVEIERDRLVRGRRADPARPDEVTINEPTARLGGIDVGDELVIHTLSPAQVDAEEYFPPRGPDLAVTVTGVTRGPGDLNSRLEGNVRATPAAYPEVAGRVDEFAVYVAVSVRPGLSAADFEDELATISSDGPLDVLPVATFTRPARQTISTLATGLAVLAGVAALAALVVIAQAVGRTVDDAVDDDPTLRALGLLRRERVSALAAAALPAAIAGAVLAVVVSVVASPLAPIGLARRAEPEPGVRIDASVLVFGALLTGVVVAAAAFAAGGLATRVRRPRLAEHPSTAATAVARLGAGPPVVHGVALAFDQRAGGRTMRSTVGALGVLVLVAVAASTFAASLHELAASSARWGAPWDLAADFTSDDVDAAADDLAADDDLATVARWDSGATLIDGEYVRAFSADVLRGEFGFSLVEGRQPGAGEVVVGPQTADRGGLALGDEALLASPDGDDEGTTVRVVGIALFPEIDDGDFVDAVGLSPGDFATHAAVPDLFEASQVVLRLDPSAPADEVESRLRERYGDDSFGNAHPVRPGVIGNLTGVLPIPRLLLAFAAVLGLAALAHAVRSTASRRAGVLATLRAIGMTRRQRWVCSLAQAVALGFAALLGGIPLGVVVGRAAWSAVAESIDVAADPQVPVVAMVLVVVATLAGAVAAATSAWPLLGRRTGDEERLADYR